jgi:hypothetical protein
MLKSRVVVLSAEDVRARITRFEVKYGFTSAEFKKDPTPVIDRNEDDAMKWDAYLDMEDAMTSQDAS